MHRTLISVSVGLLIAVVFAAISYVTDSAGGAWHHLRDIFIGPPLWVLQTGLPAVSPGLAIAPGSPYSGASFFLLFFIVFWWAAAAIVVFGIRRQPPNNSSKPTPLRGAA
jgi:hypothetical protein